MVCHCDCVKPSKHGTGDATPQYDANVVKLRRSTRVRHKKEKSPSVKCPRRHGSLPDMVHISVGNVCAVIPDGSGHGHFGIKIIEDLSCVSVGHCITRGCISPIVYMQPHGTMFSRSNPATIYLPVDFKKLNRYNKVICLSSNTALGEKFNWKPMDGKNYELFDNYVKITTTHFSFYTTVANKGYPEVSKMIYADEGGILEIPHIPGLEVVFPASAVHYDIEATMKVMFADEPYDVDHNDPGSFALATPVVKLGPTGHYFNPNSKQKVTVRLPLPDARIILENCNRPFLTFWESRTAEGQPLEWKLFKTEPKIEVDENGAYSVVFPVRHFTFFKSLWSVLDSAVHEAKIGASFFYPHFEFCVVFQAFMSRSEDDKTFGLCIVCYRVGNDLENVGHYPVFVGSSSPRMMVCGQLQIRISSMVFGPNRDVGEEMLQQQEFFAGRQFDKQFACKYIVPDVPVCGTIGKIYIEKVMEDGSVKPLFDFLVNKPRPGQEMLQSPTNSNQSQASGGHERESWEEELSKELATLLNIKKDCDLEDDVWEDIAHNLGYTQLEIDMKFKGEERPLKTLLEDYKKRGGSYNEFSSAMYKIKRKGNVDEFEQRIRQALPDHDSDLDDSVAGKNGSLSPSRSSSTSGVVLPQMPTNSRKRRHSIENRKDPVSPAKLIEIAKEKTVQEKWKNLGRALGVDDNQLLEIERNYENDGIQEKAYQMLLAWQERYPEEGSDDLIKALGKWHLNGVARLLYFNP